MFKMNKYVISLLLCSITFSTLFASNEKEIDSLAQEFIDLDLQPSFNTALNYNPVFKSVNNYTVLDVKATYSNPKEMQQLDVIRYKDNKEATYFVWTKNYCLGLKKETQDKIFFENLLEEIRNDILVSSNITFDMELLTKKYKELDLPLSQFQVIDTFIWSKKINILKNDQDIFEKNYFTEIASNSCALTKSVYQTCRKRAMILEKSKEFLKKNISAKLTTINSVTIPKCIRTRYSLSPGQYILFTQAENDFTISKCETINEKKKKNTMKISSSYGLTIPIHIRTLHNLQYGDYALFKEKGPDLYIEFSKGKFNL